MLAMNFARTIIRSASDVLDCEKAGFVKNLACGLSNVGV